MLVLGLVEWNCIPFCCERKAIPFYFSRIVKRDLAREIAAIRRGPLRGTRGRRPRDVTKERAGGIPLLVSVARAARLPIAGSARNPERFLALVLFVASH